MICDSATLGSGCKMWETASILAGCAFVAVTRENSARRNIFRSKKDGNGDVDELINTSSVTARQAPHGLDNTLGAPDFSQSASIFADSVVDRLDHRYLGLVICSTLRDLMPTIQVIVATFANTSLLLWRCFGETARSEAVVGETAKSAAAEAAGREVNLRETATVATAEAVTSAVVEAAATLLSL
jgi:hypothetical protein